MKASCAGGSAEEGVPINPMMPLAYHDDTDRRCFGLLLKNLDSVTTIQTPYPSHSLSLSPSMRYTFLIMHICMYVYIYIICIYTRYGNKN